MSNRLELVRRFQRHPSVRLRHKSWGGGPSPRPRRPCRAGRRGLRHGRRTGQGAELPDLRRLLRTQGHPAQRLELAAFVCVLEDRGVVRHVAHDAPDLPPDPRRPGRGAEDRYGSESPDRSELGSDVSLQPPLRLLLRRERALAGTWGDPEVRHRIVERLAAWGVLEVAMGGGEPTTLPDFAALLVAIRAVALVANVTTNGTNHRPEVIRPGRAHRGGPPVGRPTRVPRRRAQAFGVFARLRQTASELARAGQGVGVNLLLTPDNIRDLRRSLDEAVGLESAERHPFVFQGGLGLRPLAGLPQSPRPGGRGRGRAILHRGPPVRTAVRRYGPGRGMGRAGAARRP